jgi:site-specific DNA-methyltransferase (adenine-specific)
VTTWTDGVRAHLDGVRIDYSADYLIAQCPHATLAAAMTAAGLACDALIVDAPYSALTHAGQPDPGADGTHRRPLEYVSWSPDDVAAFVSAWHPLANGWIVSITDSELAPSWRARLNESYRQTFQPLPLVERGMTVRKTGDGPSSWATWAVVARPRGAPWSKWGTLDGAYVGPSERKDVVGGKPEWLMRRIVGDYSRPGDLVCDPCMGAGTTLVAAVELGRRAIGCEPDAGRFEMARKRVSAARPQMTLRLDTGTGGAMGAQSGIDWTAEEPGAAGW